MCGRYTLTRTDHIAEEFEAALGDAPASAWWKPRFNVAPTQPAPVIVAGDGRSRDSGGGGRKLALMRWGLVPHWSGAGGRAGASGPRAPLMINARVETLESKAMFRDALRRRRCLVPADGFFEWLRAPGAGGKARPQPIYMHPASRRLIAFAGLWAWAPGAPGAQAVPGAPADAAGTLSFTIVTGPPNELVRPFHDRMPIVVDPAAYAAWLDPATDGPAARALLGVPLVGDWIAEAVSPLVNSAARDEPACIEPLATAPPAQRSLFD